jgi:hypothetical protein
LLVFLIVIIAAIKGCLKAARGGPSWLEAAERVINRVIITFYDLMLL